jgi:hypothetical protein
MKDMHRTLPAEDIETLLPWYAAGALDPREAERVAAAVATDAGLARRLDLCREELTGTVAANEALGVPSARAARKLFAAIDRERTGEHRSAAVPGGLIAWLAGLMSPRAYALAGAAAVAVMLVEAGVIAKLALQDQPVAGSGSYMPASMPSTPAAPASMPGAPAGSASMPGAAPEAAALPATARGAVTSAALQIGAFARVKFGPDASVSELSRFLDGRSAEIVGGPHDGFYRIRISPDMVTKQDLDRLTREFRSSSPMIVSAEAD